MLLTQPAEACWQGIQLYSICPPKVHRALRNSLDAAVSSEPLDGFALSSELQAVCRILHYMVTQPDPSVLQLCTLPRNPGVFPSLYSAPIATYQILSFSRSLFFLFFFFGQITQAEVYKCPITQMLCDRKPISSRFVTPYSPVSYRWEACVPVFPQASSLVPSSPPRKFLFCWHQCGCCNCS